MAVNEDDGATAVVLGRKPRKGLPHREAADIALLPPGGKLGHLAQPRRDAINVRQQGRMPVKMSLTHAKVFKALWQSWMDKRLSGSEDLTSTVAEVTARLQVPEASIREALASLVTSGVVRQGEGYSGRTAKRLTYLPLQYGIDLLAVVEYFGEGTQIQIGRKAADWMRAQEPPNVFDFALLFKGGK